MALTDNLSLFSTRTGVELKSIRTLLNGNVANLNALTTTAKGNLVLAINEINAKPSGGATINDATTATTTVWSSSKTSTELSSAVAALVASAPSTLDTLIELSNALGGDANFAATTATALGFRVRFDAAQTLTAPQKLQALDNIGGQLASDIGDTSTDFVAIFEAALV